jgi:hypothetical protein
MNKTANESSCEMKSAFARLKSCENLKKGDSVEGF